MSNIEKQDNREKFEAWAEEAGALPWGHLKKQRTTSGNYSVQIYTCMWHAWNACYEALLDELEAGEKRIAELDASHSNLREAMAGIHNTVSGGGAYTPLAAIQNASKRAYEDSAVAAGKGEAS